jgi:fermentation-respiration switch protein FrsA (DUF1100 family)
MGDLGRQAGLHKPTRMRSALISTEDAEHDGNNPANAAGAGRRIAALPSCPHAPSRCVTPFSYDPARLIAGFSKPVLILQGERDIQVDVPDARRLAESAREAGLVLLPDTNHVLKAVISADRRANLATYFDPSPPLAPGVVDAIADFVTASDKSP